MPEGSDDELGKRFAARAGAVDGREGFEGFELLKPTYVRNVWLVANVGGEGSATGGYDFLRTEFAVGGGVVGRVG